MATRAGHGGGSLRRRGDRKWELRVSTGRDPVKGRYRYVSRTVRGTRKEAEAALAALVTQVNTGIGGHTGTDATVAELVEEWLDLKRDALSVTTWGLRGQGPVPADPGARQGLGPQADGARRRRLLPRPGAR